MRVLLVEDDERVRRCIRWLLEDDGIDVVDADGSVSLESQAAASDAVVLDLCVEARCEGARSALEQLAGSTVDTPVVVFSAYGQPYLRSLAESLGAAAFVERATEGHLLGDVIRKTVANAGAATG